MTDRMTLLVLLLLAIGGCRDSLPGGYSIHLGGSGKAWLRKPDATLAHGALIKQLFKDDRHVLLITFTATLGGEADGPRPLDGNCYIALLIDTKRRHTRQVRLAEARELATKMDPVLSSEQGCLQGMLNS